jgi:vitamin B12 transporter
MRSIQAVLSAIVVLGAPALLPAQQRDSTVNDSTPAFRLQPLLVSISKTPIRIERSGFSVSVLTRQALAASQPLHAADALRNVGGAHIDEAVGAGGPTIIRLRSGEEVFTQILMDGVQVNQNGGYFDFQGLTFSNVDRIEVARGPQSAVWGSSAMTGVVNFITRPGEPGPTLWQAQIERGIATVRSNSYVGNGSVSGGSERLRYSASLGTTFVRGIHLVPHDLSTRELALRLDAAPARTLEFTAIARGVDVSANLPVRDPGATRAPLDPNARNERDRLIGLLQARHAITPNWLQQLRLSTYREQFYYGDRRDDVPASDEYFIFDANFGFDSRLRRLTGEYLWTFTPVSLDWLRSSLGAQWERERLSEETRGDFGDDESTRQRDSRAGFLEIVASPHARLDVLASTRFEKYDGLAAEHTPRAGLSFALLPERLRLRLAAARGFKAPNLREQYLDNPFIASNPDLRAERSTSWELGADFSTDSGLQASATFFRQTFRDLVRTVQLTPDRQINRNLGRSEAHGLEWELTARPHERLALRSAGFVIDTRIRDNTGLVAEQYPLDEALPFRPAYRLMLGSEWQPLARVSTALRATHVGTQYVLTERFSGRREKLAAYTVLGFNLGYTHSDQARIYLRIDNLLDREYATAYDQRGMPLTASLGVILGNR